MIIFGQVLTIGVQMQSLDIKSGLQRCLFLDLPCFQALTASDLINIQ